MSTRRGGIRPPAVTRTGPEPVLGVGAAAGVGVVVGQVGADLDEHAAHQRGDEGQRRGTRPPRSPARCPPAPARPRRGASAAARPRPQAQRRRRGALGAGSRPLGELAEVRRGASRGRRRGPPGPPRCRRRGGWRRGRAAGCPASPSSAALKLAFSSRSENGDRSSISRHQRTVSVLELLERRPPCSPGPCRAPPARRTGGRGTRSPWPSSARPGRPAALAPKPPSKEPTFGPGLAEAGVVGGDASGRSTTCSTWPPPIA